MRGFLLNMVFIFFKERKKKKREDDRNFIAFTFVRKDYNFFGLAELVTLHGKESTLEYTYTTSPSCSIF